MVRFTEEILNGKLHFQCSVRIYVQLQNILDEIAALLITNIDTESKFQSKILCNNFFLPLLKKNYTSGVNPLMRNVSKWSETL